MKEIFIYKYSGDHTLNLGDEIQVLAMTNVLKKIGITVAGYYDKDAPAPAPKNTNLLINGYVYLSNIVHTNLREANFIFSNLHIFKDPNDSESTIRAAIEKLSTSQPILCRDRWTTEFLRTRGLEAVLNYCPSLCFDKREKAPVNGKVFAVDMWIWPAKKKLLNCAYLPYKLRGEKVHHISHNADPRDSFSERLKKAQDLLNMYKHEAKLVITRRLHAALPCIAMGVPVVLVYPWQHPDKNRMDLAKEFIPIFDLSPLRQFEQINKILYIMKLIGLPYYSPEPLDIEDYKQEIITRTAEIINLRAK